MTTYGFGCPPMLPSLRKTGEQVQKLKLEDIQIHAQTTQWYHKPNLMFFWPCIIVQAYFNNQLNAQFLYSIIICMLHYNLRHVSGINMPIFRTNCIITASGIVTLCEWPYSMPDERSLLSSGILYSCLQTVMIPDAVIIQFVLLKMGVLMLETCRGL